MSSGDDGTKIIYHIDEEDTPYLIKLAIPSEKVTLKDFRDALQKPNYKYFFKSMDADFGVVKEEIVDDEKHLPSFNGRVVSWLVTADSSDTQSQQGADSVKPSEATATLPPERVGGIGDSRPPSFHANGGSSVVSHDDDHLESEALDTLTEVDSRFTSVSARDRHRKDRRRPKQRSSHHHAGKMPPRHYESSTVTSSDLESSSYFTEDDYSSRYTGETASSYYGERRARRQRKTRHQMGGGMRHAESFSSVTDSSMSYDVITVILNMDKVNFLGISIVGQSNKGGDGGIYVGSIMKGGAVALDGQIEPGDMILEVNDISFENMTNDDAVQTLREAVQHPGRPVRLVVAKCWDPAPESSRGGGYFTIPRQEPVRPIDPSAWVAHTTALQQQSAAAAAAARDRDDLGMNGTLTRAGVEGGLMGMHRGGPMDSFSESSSLTDTTATTPLVKYDSSGILRLSHDAPMELVVRAMMSPESGLEIRDRLWLKITIPRSFIGSELVIWLLTRVEGFVDRRDARKYACNLLRNGFIIHTVNKRDFSEQCYYQFSQQAPSVAATGAQGGADISGAMPDMSCMSLYDSQESPSEVSSPRGSHLSLPPPTHLSLPPPSHLLSAPGSIPHPASPSPYSTYHQSIPSVSAAGGVRHGSAGQLVGMTSGAGGSGAPLSGAGYYQHPLVPPPTSSLEYAPPPSYSYVNGAHSFNSVGKAAGGSQRSGSGSSGKRSSPANSGSETGSIISVRRGRPSGVSEASYDLGGSQPLPPPPGELANMPLEVSASKQSFRAAMGNPCEYFVDAV